MRTVTSRDGTGIAYEARGSGPAVVVVLGALADRRAGSVQRLADRLAAEFTVYTYDRRGRGESGDTQPYAVEREIDDLEALIDAAGGRAFLYGHSSGGALALLAAAALESRVRGLAVYDIPYTDDPQGRAAWQEYISRLTRLLADGKKGDAVALFLRVTGLSDGQVAGVRQSPSWPAMEAAGRTLAYDHAAVLGPDAAVPADAAARVTAPALVLNGGASFPFMRASAERLSTLIPHARLRVLEGETHDVRPEAIAPVLAAFFQEVARGDVASRPPARPGNARSGGGAWT